MKKLFTTNLPLSLFHFWLLLLRIGAAGLMLTHGYPKLLKLVEGNMTFGDPYGIGAGLSLVLIVFAEALCSVLIGLGLATRLATLPLIFAMYTAAFVVHADDPFAKQEMPILYILIYATILVAGPGKYSIDQKIGK